MEAGALSKSPYIYRGRGLLPARFNDNRLQILNTHNATCRLDKGTHLGVAETLSKTRPQVWQIQAGELLSVEEVRQQMMEGLPPHLNKQQRNNVEKLLKDYADIFSRGEYDIGKTDYVEYKIDTGTHRPIRQLLRRHPFKHLEEIDNQVEEMRAHGIVEPAASPWASNVVLVKKKMDL